MEWSTTCLRWLMRSFELDGWDYLRLLGLHSAREPGHRLVAAFDDPITFKRRFPMWRSLDNQSDRFQFGSYSYGTKRGSVTSLPGGRTLSIYRNQCQKSCGRIRITIRERVLSTTINRSETLGIGKMSLIALSMIENVLNIRTKSPPG